VGWTYPARNPVYRSKSIKISSCTRTLPGPVRPVGPCRTGHSALTGQTARSYRSDRLVPILAVNTMLQVFSVVVYLYSLYMRRDSQNYNNLNTIYGMMTQLNQWLYEWLNISAIVMSNHHVADILNQIETRNRDEAQSLLLSLSLSFCVHSGL
jgi:hypothetical protein